VGWRAKKVGERGERGEGMLREGDREEKKRERELVFQPNA